VSRFRPSVGLPAYRRPRNRARTGCSFESRRSCVTTIPAATPHPPVVAVIRGGRSLRRQRFRYGARRRLEVARPSGSIVTTASDEVPPVSRRAAFRAVDGVRGRRPLGTAPLAPGGVDEDLPTNTTDMMCVPPLMKGCEAGEGPSALPTSTSCRSAGMEPVPASGTRTAPRCCIAVIVCASRASTVEARFRWCRAPTQRGDPT
jgi:hypothetical protein